MTDSFVVLNPTHNQVTLVFKPPFTMQDELHMSKHKRRRKVRGAITTVTVPSNASVDLVELTTFDSTHLEKNEDLQLFFKLGRLKDMREVEREVVKEPVIEIEEPVAEDREAVVEDVIEEPAAVVEDRQEEVVAKPAERVEEPAATTKKPKRKKGRRKKADV